MIELPGFPRTFTSRQIECVSCHNYFAVAEEFIEENQPDEVRPSPADNPLENDGWRISQDHIANIQLHFQEARTNQQIGPPTSSSPSLRVADNQLLAANHDNFLCCPRCGADNRNWVQIQNRRMTLPLIERFNASRLPQLLLVAALAVSVATILFAVLVPDWLPESLVPITAGVIAAGLVLLALLHFSSSTFPDAAGQGMLLGAGSTAVLIALFAFAAIVIRAPNSVWEQAVPLGLTAVAAGILPAWIIAKNWQKVFCRVREHRSLPDQFRSPIWYLTMGGAVSALLFTGVIPILLYIFFPVVFDAIFDRPEPSLISAIQEDISVIQEKLNQWQNQENTSDAQNQILIQLEGDLQQSSQKLLTGEQQLSELRELIGKLEKDEALPPGLMKEIRAEVDGLKETEAELNIFVAGQKKPSFLLPPTISWQFYFFWLFFVGFNTLMATVTGAAVSICFANQVNKQLPPPIFHSIAAMTRVVAWEAKKALEVRGVIMDYIQWTAVARNELGGITLSGLHRDQPKLQVRDVAIGRRVPAQVYTIKSDRWANIVDATIYSTTAGHAPRVPDTDLSQDFFAEIDQRAYENLRP